MLNTRMRAYLDFRARTVRRAVNDGKLRGLYRTAGLIRTTAKRSMRLKAGASQAGSPPHAHTRLGLRVISFAVDRSNYSAIVGPEKFSGSNFLNEPVPHVHEFGGTFLTLRGISYYPERSFMHWTLKRLNSSGSINKNFSVSLARAF